MSSEQFQAAYDSIESTGTRLLQYLLGIREGRRSEGNYSQGLQSIEDDLNKALKALQEQKYQVAVVAAMSAGKSTFLNALIGADVLASETAACTICRTDVRHIDVGQVPRLLEYREGQRLPDVIAKGDAGEIQQKFLVRTREIREKGNPDNTIRFEIEHPIEAISALSSLSGFTLVDTPGANEWESTNFNTVALKQTALEALRTCNAILFVLNYATYKDNAVSDLFKEVIQNRQELLAENKGKIYFILNKVDQKTERDREIPDVIEDLKRELAGFGFPDPIIYPASSRQGLLAKLIERGEATESQTKDFKKFFTARYATEDEEGNQIIPAPRKIAPQALEDSGIPTIQETVIQTITQNSGWNLLSDDLAILDKAAKDIEENLNTQINGWATEIEQLKQIVGEYRTRSESTKSQVEAVEKSVQEKEQELINRFNQGINIFANGAKTEIQKEIARIAESRSVEPAKANIQEAEVIPKMDVPSNDISMDLTVPNPIPLFGGFSFSFRVQRPLVEALKKVIPAPFDSSDSPHSKISDPYKIRVDTREDAQKIGHTVNEFCTPHIQSWWIDTQDQLVREGTRIREELVQQIQEQIQHISNELSDYLGEALKVDLKINPIQFPGFEFEGIDAQIQHQQEVYTRSRKETRRESRCCNSDKVYEVDVPYQEQRSFIEVDLRKTAELIKLKIDEQVSRNLGLIQRVIEKQVAADFRSAEQQINDYIKRFQDELNRLVEERQKKEKDPDRILTNLQAQKAALNQYLSELSSIRAFLNSWKPVQTLNKLTANTMLERIHYPQINNPVRR